MSKPLFLLGEAYGKMEAQHDAGFISTAGIELLAQLGDAGLLTWTATDADYLRAYWRSGDDANSRDPSLIDMIWRLHPEFHRANVFNIHPPGNDLGYFCGGKSDGIPGYPALLKSKYVLRTYASELDRLAEEIESVDPNLIVCLGNTALWALAGRTGVGKLRGTTLLSTHCISGYKLLPTYHPAAVVREWSNRSVTVIDLMKAKRQAEYPDLRRPPCEIWIEPGIADMENFRDLYIHPGQTLSVDIETSGNQITCVGLAPEVDRAIVIPFFDERRSGHSYWPDVDSERLAWAYLRGILEDPAIPKLFQNGVYDIAFLARSVGILVRGAEHDTLLLHHALQPESLKGLAFLGSIYTDHGPWKLERKGTSTIKKDE